MPHLHSLKLTARSVCQKAFYVLLPPQEILPCLLPSLALQWNTSNGKPALCTSPGQEGRDSEDPHKSNFWSSAFLTLTLSIIMGTALCAYSSISGKGTEQGTRLTEGVAGLTATRYSQENIAALGVRAQYWAIPWQDGVLLAQKNVQF